MKAPLLSIDGLSVQREGKIVLEIPHLEVEHGSVAALTGPNGAGKTTLLLVLMRLLKPVRGEIRLDDIPITDFSDLDYRRRVTLVMQDPLMLDRTVFENIALGLRFRRLPKEELRLRVELWLDRLQITHLRERKATRLSGGEAQRVALARSLVVQPDLLLLDEPFHSLDRPAHAALLADLKSLLPDSGTTVIYSTHSSLDVRQLASQKINLENGRISPAAV